MGEIIGGIFPDQQSRDESRDANKGNRPVRSHNPDPQDATERAFSWQVTNRWWISQRDTRDTYRNSGPDTG